jgi:hypothetical protein
MGLSMMSAVNQDASRNRAWSPNPTRGNWGNSEHGPWANQWGQPGTSGLGAAAPPFWHPAGMSRPVAIGFTILGFMFWWPVGLALLFYMIGSGRMGCFGRNSRASYQNWQEAGPFSNWKSWAYGTGRHASSSGNHAFDEYKSETLRRLEEEQKEFSSFLERLRFAKDKAEFDQFMAERRARPQSPRTEEQAST